HARIDRVPRHQQQISFVATGNLRVQALLLARAGHPLRGNMLGRFGACAHPGNDRRRRSERPAVGRHAGAQAGRPGCGGGTPDSVQVPGANQVSIGRVAARTLSGVYRHSICSRTIRTGAGLVARARPYSNSLAKEPSMKTLKPALGTLLLGLSLTAFTALAQTSSGSPPAAGTAATQGASQSPQAGAMSDDQVQRRYDAEK